MHFKASYALTGFWSRASDLVLWVHAWQKRHSQIFIASASALVPNIDKELQQKARDQERKAVYRNIWGIKAWSFHAGVLITVFLSLFFVSLTLNSTICLARGLPLSWGGSNNCERTVFSPQNALFNPYVLLGTFSSTKGCCWVLIWPQLFLCFSKWNDFWWQILF